MTNWFRFIAEPMAHILVFLAENVWGAGVAIVLFTLAVKLVLVPLTLQQLRSSKSMQELQPLIKELQTKYKNDKQKLTEETMALYKEHKVNPAAGCLPLVLQLPILYGLYGALLDLGNTCASKVNGACVPDALYNPLFGQPFLWLNGHVANAGGAVLTGLAAPDPLHILPIICVVAQWVQQRMMMSKQKPTDSQQAMMQQMMQFMPLMIGFFAWNYASGLALYWAISTIFSIVQQYFITGWGSLATLGKGGGSGFSLAGLLSSGTGSSNGSNGSHGSSNGHRPRAASEPQRTRRNTPENPRARGSRRPNGKR